MRPLLLFPALLLVAAVPTLAQTTYTWNGGAGQWNTDTNWSPVGIPGPGDTAVITANGSEVELTSAVTVANLTLDEDLFTTLQGTDLTVTGSMTWSGGATTLFASRLIIAAGATATLTNSVTFEGFLDVYGTLTHGGTSTDLILENGADVAVYGLYEVTATGNLAEIRGDGTFSVALTNPGQIRGVFRKAAGSGSRFVVSCFSAEYAPLIIGVSIYGIVEVESGELRLENEDGDLIVGLGASFSGAPGTEVWLDMPYRVNPTDPTVSISGFDRVRFGGDIAYEGALDVAILEAYSPSSTADPDTVDVTGATISNLTTVEVTGNFDEVVLPGAVAGTLDALRVTGFGGDATFTPGGPFDLAELIGTGSGSLLDFGGADVRAETISLSTNAQLFGVDDLRLKPGGGMHWENADLTVAGTFTVGAGATVALPSNENTFSGTLANNGTVLHTGTATDLVLAGGSVFTNNGTYAMATTGTFAEIKGDGAFVNNGLFTKLNDQPDHIRLDVLNNGTLDVEDGELIFDEAFVNSVSGTVMGGGTLDVTSAAPVTHSGTVAPGASPGVLVHTGDFAMSASAVLDAELGGLIVGTGHDQLTVDGDAALGGTLRLGTLVGFAPSLGDSFTVLTATGTVSGTFATEEAPVGYGIGVAYNPASVAVTITSVPNFDLIAVNTNPLGSPIVVEQGGSVAFDYSVTNHTALPATGDVWFTASPGNVSGIIQSGTIQDGQTISLSFTQPVPLSAPPTTYTYTVHIGQFPNTVVDSETFTVTVTPAAARAAGGATEWAVTDAAPWPGAETAAAGGSAAASETLPEAFALGAAYPNPFAQVTTVGFALPEAAEVRLAVYDVLGREVIVLMDERLEAGRHTARFKAAELASGVYLVRMTASDFVSVQRVTLVR